MTVTPEPPDGPDGPDGPDRPESPGPTGPTDGTTRPEGSTAADHPLGTPDRDVPPVSGPLSDSDIDSMFAGIVAGLEPQMRWGLRRPKASDGAEDRAAAGSDPAPLGGPRPAPSAEGDVERAPDHGPDDPGRSTPPAGPFLRRAGDHPPGGSAAEPDDGAGPAGADDRALRADREALEREITRRERERRAEARRDAADDRAQRRDLRKIERAAELAAFEAHQAEIQAARDADQEHYDPPEPPPVPRPRGRALGALVCLAAGLLLLIKPSLVGVAPDAALVLSVLLLFSGAGLLVWGLRARRDSDDDDGAVV